MKIVNRQSDRQIDTHTHTHTHTRAHREREREREKRKTIYPHGILRMPGV